MKTGVWTWFVALSISGLVRAEAPSSSAPAMESEENLRVELFKCPRAKKLQRLMCDQLTDAQIVRSSLPGGGHLTASDAASASTAKCFDAIMRGGG